MTTIHVCNFSSYQYNQLIIYKGYPVTIIVEGGVGSLEVLESDIKGERPIVLIQVRISHILIYIDII